MKVLKKGSNLDKTKPCSIPNINYEAKIKIRRIPSQNVVHRLRFREIYRPKCMSHFSLTRSFHQNVFPNFTVVNVEKPPCFLRKFSPDGRYFIAFSSDQTSLEIYRFEGPAAAGDLLQKLHSNKPDVADEEAESIRGRLFERFFLLWHTVNVAPNGEHLNRECSLFTDDGRYVIVGSAVYVPDEPYPHFYDMYRNNESVSPTHRSPLEDYSLHLIDLQMGVLCDTRTFKCDKIFLSHNQGLYLYKNILAVLSVQQQTIHIFQVTADGRFLDVRTIGRFCHEDDALAVSILRYEMPAANSTQNERPFRDACINSLKHRLLVYLWKRAHREGTPSAMRHFYQHFDIFRWLRMWKMQLLDEVHLLIKYASEDVVTLRMTDPTSQPSFFVVYNMVTTEVVAVFENTSEELLELLENFCDLFRNATLHAHTQLTCSASSNVYARQIQRRFKHTIINAKYGGHMEAVKRLLAQLPISSQSYSSSPYLDLSLFSYDDKWVSVMERPKACGDYPIRFYARDSGILKFKIHAGLVGRPSPPSARRLVAFTFHPYEPFAISVQRTNTEYVVNFHVRHQPAD
ncbi:DET1 homolog [Strongylocentrotus purpuratus]|uniref:DET1 homolog n=1 Tax=Strongylocentrotus purpuratus TaxID=7668 RepID=A0A7M7RH10_STRPU|nr:DET1 homolog [Strongylocentrotus purpuratus]|eukprot:XP_795871.1 PREDICTED: DET1 homolog [Strongylocentrotus purpuratus]